MKWKVKERWIIIINENIIIKSIMKTINNDLQDIWRKKVTEYVNTDKKLINKANIIITNYLM